MRARWRPQLPPPRLAAQAVRPASPQCLHPAGQALSALPILWITAYLRNPAAVSLLPYYALSTLRGAVDTMPVVLAASADALPPQHRAGMFTVLLACISLAFVIGSAVGGPMTPRGAATLSSSLLVAVGVVTVLFVPGAPPCHMRRELCAAAHKPPGADLRAVMSARSTCLATCAETLRRSQEPDAPAKETASRASGSLGERGASFWATAKGSFVVICRSRLFLQLAAIIALSGMAMECLQDLLFNYLQVTLAFGPKQLATILAELGIGGFLCQVRHALSDSQLAQCGAALRLPCKMQRAGRLHRCMARTHSACRLPWRP